MIGFFKRSKHSKTLNLLSAYIDGQVTDSEAREVEGHLSQCEECRLELESLRVTVDLVRDLPQMAIPRSFVLTEAPEQAKVGRPPLVLTTGIATSLAAVLLVALLLGEVAGIFTQSRAMDDVAVLQEAASAPVATVMVEKAIVEREIVKEVPVEVAKAVEKPIEVEKVVEKRVVKEAQAQRAVPVAPSSETEEAVAESAVGIASEKATEVTGTPAPAAMAAPASAQAQSDETPSEEAGLPGSATPESMPTEVAAPTSAEADATPTSEVTSAAPQVARVAKSEELESAPEQVTAVTAPTQPLETSNTGVPPALVEPYDGLELPLRQLQIAIGVLVAALIFATLWTVRRSGRQYR